MTACASEGERAAGTGLPVALALTTRDAADLAEHRRTARQVPRAR
ncbi:hypothetical protein [Kitasatospora phosalacinea]|nr:hypothetical protein [Kitasatospora phosalacinea]